MSFTDGQHKVPVAIQRPAPGRLLARSQRWSRGAEARSRQPGRLVLSWISAPGAGGQRRSLSSQESQGTRSPWGR